MKTKICEAGGGYLSAKVLWSGELRDVYAGMVVVVSTDSGGEGAVYTVREAGFEICDNEITQVAYVAKKNALLG